MCEPKARGFTLIEMLVVIAIIGILAAMLSGPLLRARESGLAASCKNLVKQYGVATVMYANDWGDWLPDVATYLDPDNNSFCRYFGGSEVLPQDIARCAGDSTTEALGRLYNYEGTSDGRAFSIKVSIGGVQAVLSSSINPTSKGNSPMYRKITNRAFTRSARVASWADYQRNADTTAAGAMIAVQGAGKAASESFDTFTNAVFRHDGSANACFLDGHVGLITFIKKEDLDNNGHDLKPGKKWAGTGNMAYPYGPRPENINNFKGVTTAIEDIASNVSVTYR